MNIASVSLRVVSIVAFLLLLGRFADAQEQRWNFYESLQGSTNSAGQVFKLNTAAAYSVNPHVEVGGGIPFYFVRNASDPTASSSTGVQTGIGNAYLDAKLKAAGPVTFISGITGTAPTGNRDKGFSTGKVTVDWNNYLGIPLSRVTPYVNAGVANTVSDTAFFVRPFTSSGVVGHFEGGMNLSVAPSFTIGSSAYAIAPSGEQQIVSRIVQRKASVSPVASQGNANGHRVFETEVETVGGADLASDHGFSSWMELTKASGMSFQLGYSRSIPYQFNSVFFSVGFNISSLVRQHRP